jgi:hypothetical protein
MRAVVGPARNKALKHLSNVLAFENFLCRCVRERINFESGNFFSVDPADRDFDHIEDFGWGAGVGHDKGIAGRLLKNLASSPDRFLLVDDVMGDVSSMGENSVVNNDEIYHWIVGSNATEEAVNNLVWSTGVSWHFLGVIFSGVGMVDVPRLIADGKCADVGDLVEVVVGAYDGEGFLHWRPG